MSDTSDYSNLVEFLKDKFSTGNLGVVAAYAKLSEGELREIATGEREMTEEIALALSLAVEPQDSEWEIDSDECDPMDLPMLTDVQIRERLHDAASCDKLGLVAEVSGVKGGVSTLEGILEIGGKIDPVTRMLLLNVME